MSFRDSARRQSGDSRPVRLNLDPRNFLAANTMRLRAVGVKAGAAPTTVDVQVNGVSVLAKSNPSSGAVPASGFVQFNFGGGVVMNRGDVLLVTSTDPAALATADFMAA